MWILNLLCQLFSDCALGFASVCLAIRACVLPNHKNFVVLMTRRSAVVWMRNRLVLSMLGSFVGIQWIFIIRGIAASGPTVSTRENNMYSQTSHEETPIGTPHCPNAMFDKCLTQTFYISMFQVRVLSYYCNFLAAHPLAHNGQ